MALKRLAKQDSPGRKRAVDDPDRQGGHEPAPAAVPVAALVRRHTGGAAPGGAAHVGAANDPAEAEADATARTVVQALRSGVARTVDRHGNCQNGCGHEAGRDDTGRHEGAPVRRQATVGAEGGELDAGTRDKLGRLRGGGRPLPDPVRASMEAAFGADLSGVRVHTGPAAAEVNHAIQARAFTAGSDIAFAGGMPDTSTESGQHLLAHELTHVLQNGGGAVRRTLREQGSDDTISWPELVEELEGDDVAYSAAAGLVLRYWAGSAKARTYSSLSSLVKSATDAVPVIEPEFAASLLTLGEVREFLASATSARRKTKAGPKLVEALQARQQQLQKDFGDGLGSGYALPAPNLDPRYHTPSALTSKVADTSGRKDGAWHQTKNTVSGSGGKKTGSVNLALLQSAQSDGSVQQIGTHLEQVCPTCATSEHVASFEVDHQQAFSDIRDRLHLVAAVMTENSDVYASVRKDTKNFDQIFSVTGKPGKPGFTVEALASGVHRYSNNLDNLMRICRLCNGGLGKSDMDMIEWYRQSPLYGQAFLDEYQLPGGSTRVIELTKTGVGWGVAARKWFTEKHLPVLSHQFISAKIAELTRQRLIGESTLGLAAQREQDPHQRQQRSDEHQQQVRNNQAMLGGLEGMHGYHSAPTTAPFGINSPPRYVEQHKEVDVQRDKRKLAERLTTLPAYQVGLDDAKWGSRAHEKDYPQRSTEWDAYQQAQSDAGARDQELWLEGERDALTWDLTMRDPEVWGDGFHYAMGYTAVLDRRRKAYDAGFALAEQDAVPDPRYGKGEKYAEQLLRDYLLGYETAVRKARLAKRRASSQATRDGGPSAFDPSVQRPNSASPQYRIDQYGTNLPGGFPFSAPRQPSVPVTFGPYGQGNSSAPSPQPQFNQYGSFLPGGMYHFGSQPNSASQQGGFGAPGPSHQQVDSSMLEEEDEERMQ